MKKAIKHILLPVACCGVFCSFASAQSVGVEAQSHRNVQGAPGGVSNDGIDTFSNFDLNGGNALAVLFTTENGNLPTVTYDGTTVTNNVWAAMNGGGTFADSTGAGTGDDNGQLSAIYWLLNPAASSGDVVVTYDSGELASISVLSLSNVDGVGATGFGYNDTGSDITTGYNGLAGSYVVGASVDNAVNGTAPTIGAGSDNFDTTFLSYDGVNGSPPRDSASRGHFGGAIAADGSYEEVFNMEDGRSSAALLEFTAVPEPSALAFFSMIGFLMVLRRRRA